MTDIERACEHRCAMQPCKHICEYAALYVAGMNAGRKEREDEIKQVEQENERIRRTMLTYSECITEHQNTIKRKDEENKKIKKQWHDCFLSCSSPYCAAHFPAVEMQGELGNMSKREPEAEK